MASPPPPSLTLSPSPHTSPTSTRTRTRSLSPSPFPSHSLSALAPSSPPHPSSSSTMPTSASVIRPSPVVPPSPSVPPTPSFGVSRPTSPAPPAQPASPTTRGRAASGGGVGGGGNLAQGTLEAKGGTGGGDGALSKSASQVDLSHIFERDVEFAPSHLITPSEAVDVAVPPVLTEAAVALSYASEGDPISSHDLAALALDAEQDVQAGSGWSSPGGGVGLSLLHGGGAAAHGYQPAHSSPLHHGAHSHHANASRSPVRGGGGGGGSGTARSFSPDSTLARAVSPDSSTTFSVGTPPTSNSGGSPPPLGGKEGSPPPQIPALSLGPFGQRLAEALENEANKLPPGLAGTVSASAGAAKERDTSPDSAKPAASSYTPLKPSLLLPFPGGPTTTSTSSSSHTLLAAAAAADDPFSSFTPASLQHPHSPLHSPSYELANPFLSTSSSSATPSPSSSALPGAAGGPALVAPHPRRLSFTSYASLINDERLSELKGEGIGGDGASAVPPVATPRSGGLVVEKSREGREGREGTREAGSRNVSGGSRGSALPSPALALGAGGKEGGEGGEVEVLRAKLAGAVLES
ncbi:hypothetical protein JCM8547_003501 [Rhodosporidiobolus lusitaniae]